MKFERYGQAEKLSTAEQLSIFDSLQENQTVWSEVYRVCNNQGFSPEVLRNMVEDAAEDVPQHLKRVGQILLVLSHPALQPEDAREKTEELLSLVKLV